MEQIDVSLVLRLTDAGERTDAAVCNMLQDSPSVAQVLILAESRQWGLAAGSAHHPRVRVLASSGFHGADALNHAVREATGEFIWIVRDERRLTRDFLEQCIRPMREDLSCAFTASEELSTDTADTTPDLPGVLSRGNRLCIYAARTDVLHAIGGFDQRLDSTVLDWDILIRLLAAGYSGKVVPAAAVPEERPAPSSDALKSVLQKHVLLVQRFDRDLQALLETNLRDTPVKRELDWGSLRRCRPFADPARSPRGVSIPAYYRDAFIAAHEEDLSGSLLDVIDGPHAAIDADDPGGATDAGRGFAKRNVLRLDDLGMPGMPEARYDCLLLPDTLELRHPLAEVLDAADLALAPGGVLLATVPCVAPLHAEPLPQQQWRLTPLSARRAFERVFGAGHVELHPLGNVLACCAALMGIAADELTPDELDYNDPRYPVLLGVRVVKAESDDLDRELLIRHARIAPNADDLADRRSPERAFRIVAFVTAFNDGDIVAATIAHLVENGIEVYLLDAGSVDDTVEQARSWLGRGLIRVESLSDANVAELDTRVRELATALSASWVIVQRADQMLEAPLPAVSIRETVAWADRLEFDSVDANSFLFPPVDDGFRQGMDPRRYFSRVEAKPTPAAFFQCWKRRTPVRVSEGTRTPFPFPFLIRQYGARGESQGRWRAYRESASGLVAETAAADMGSPVYLRNPASLWQFDLELFRLQSLEVRGSAERRQDLRISGPSEPPHEAEGFLDATTCEIIAGWAWYPDAPEEAATLDIWDGARLLGTVTADLFRDDLRDAGKRDGFAGFQFVPPYEMHDGRAHLIWVNITGTARQLKHSPGPMACTCGSNAPVEAGSGS